MMTAQDEYRDQFLRFVAACILLLGIVSLAWALYLYSFYPVDPKAIGQRIVFSVAMILGGFVCRVFIPSPSPRQSWLNPGNSFIGSHLDGLIFYILLLAIPIALLLVWSCIHRYLVARSSDENYVGVKVRVESIDLKHVSPEQLPNESFYPIYKEVYFIPEKYHDLWVAFGDVTLIEKDGHPTEPATLRANYTVPHSEGYREGGRSKTFYLEHYKMNAVMDSERFEVGKTYNGWLLREQESDVFFSRSSDLAKKDLIIIASLASAVCVYLTVRIRIGMKRQDKHWRGMKEIWTSDSRDSESNRSRQ